MVVNSRNSYDVLFRSCLGNIRCRAVNTIPKAKIYFNMSRMTQSVTSTTPLGGVGGGEPPAPNYEVKRIKKVASNLLKIAKHVTYG